MSGTTRERNARGHGGLLRREVPEAVDRLVGDDERMRPKALALREVAREAGIAAPSIYQHFRNKDELIQAAVSEGVDLLVQSMGDAAARYRARARPSDRLAAHARAYCRFAEEHRGYFRLIAAGTPKQPRTR